MLSALSAGLWLAAHSYPNPEEDPCRPTVRT